MALSLVPPAWADEAAVARRLEALGFSANVAAALAARRPDLHAPVLAEVANGVPVEQSAYRPVKRYRGVNVAIEEYDAVDGRGPIMVADGVRWVSALSETARFYAGLVGARPRRNAGIVLELEIPRALIAPGGTSLAEGLPLAAAPDESVFAARIGLGHYALERGSDGGLDHRVLGAERPAELTWFPAEEILENGKVRLPPWARTGCGRTLRGLGEGLPPMNPLF
jgi:hypothetical protein